MARSAVGKAIPKKDAIEKVTGQAQFTGDLTVARMLHAAVLRSPHAHARIRRVETAAARSCPGVRAVVTGAECNFFVGVIINDQTPLAIGTVRFAGEPVAAVIAETGDAARAARELIAVEYELLPAVTDVYAALEPTAPKLHDQFPNNIFHHYQLRKGDTAKGFAASDLIVENEFSYPHVSHCQLETHGAIARWNREGSLEVWASCQSPFFLREVLATMFALKVTDVRVKIPYLGGGFGGKSDVTIEPLVAAIARAVPGEAVRLVLSREEAFVGSLLGRGMRGKIKTGVTKDGAILAVEIEMHFNAGAYAGYCLPIVEGGGQNAAGPYTIPHLKTDAYGVYTNTPFVGAFRGYGHPEGAWMTERQLDIIAAKLKLDPVHLRLRNCWQTGDTNQLGQTVKHEAGQLAKCIRKTTARLGWGKRNVTVNGDTIRAKGIACFMKSPVMTTNAASAAIVKFAVDGTVNLSVGTTDIGQGSITALSQICAEALGLPVEHIQMARHTDTQYNPYEWQTVASRGVWSVGNAIVLASRDAIEKLKRNAGFALKVPAARLEYRSGTVFVKGKPAKKIALKAICHGVLHPDGHGEGGPVVGYGCFVPTIYHRDPTTGQGNCVGEWTGGCQGIELEIDRRTGEVTVLKLVTTVDPGTVINPQLARGQVVGAVVQGLGQALHEGIVYSAAGKLRNDHFTDYKIPTPEEVAATEFTVHFIETPEADGPYGGRSLGEHAIVAIPALVGNAIRNGTGLDFFDLPLTADQLARALAGPAGGVR